MKHKISRQETINAVALAGISAAVALLMVWLGVVVRFSTVAFFIAASIAVMVPASQKYYFSSVFAYLVSAGLSFLVAGDVFSVMGYVVYFGPMAIITATFFNYKDKVKWWIALIVKMVYINGALAILYFLCNNIVIDESIIDKVQYWMIALFGTIILVAVDYLLQFIYKRAGILLSRVLRKKGAKTSDADVYENDEEDAPTGKSPFEEWGDFSMADDNFDDDKGDDCDDKNGKNGNDIDDKTDDYSDDTNVDTNDKNDENSDGNNDEN